MKERWIKINIPLIYIKPVCMAAVTVGILFFVTDNWIAGFCMLLGSYIFEKSNYCCPSCRCKLDMKRPLMKGACCPFCGNTLRAR